MSAQTYLWIKAAHVFGFVLWIGSMVALSLLGAATRRAEGGARSALADAARPVGMAMDIGATLAIAAGVVMILGSLDPVPPLKRPYFHIKLTLAVVLIGLHGLLRVSGGRARRGAGAGPPGWILPVAVLLALGVIWLAVTRPMIGG